MHESRSEGWMQWRGCNAGQKVAKSTPEVSNSQKILFSLVICDFLVALICCPLQITGLFFVEVGLHNYFVTTLCGASSLIVILLAFEKFIKLTRYSKYQDIMTDRRVKYLVAMCWLFPIVTMSSAFWSGVVYALSNFIITFSTLTCLPVLYFHIYRFYKASRTTIREYSIDKPQENENVASSSSRTPQLEGISNAIKGVIQRRAQENSLSEEELTELRNQRKLTRKIMLLMSTYFSCTVCYNAVSFLAAFRLIDHSELFFFCFAIYLGNSALNPVIYVLRDAKFRSKIKTMFRLSADSNTSNSNTISSSSTDGCKSYRRFQGRNQVQLNHSQIDSAKTGAALRHADIGQVQYQVDPNQPIKSLINTNQPISS
ncbi:5-hydroxytryptamine receptor 1B-like [Clytia hemisphaerica]|uniref:5-hydroxytryptamine receptor 1B-like n=1 Tax=Clytia hemisphaerica TaxID=252671 RepID=UPI0034D63A59